MKENYLGTTASILDHYFGNLVGIVRLWHLDKDTTQDYKSPKKEFIEGLEKAISDNLLEYGGVTKQHLKEMVQLAQSGDWSDITTIKKLYERYHKIRQKEFDEQEFFGTG